MSHDFNFTESGYVPGNLDFNFIPPESKDLAVYVKPSVQSYNELVSIVKGIAKGITDLSADVTGVLFKSSSNLSSLINVIEVRNLSAEITPQLFKGQSDIGASFDKIFSRGQKDLNAQITCRVIILELLAYINVIDTKNLPAAIKSFITNTKNLQSYLNIIQVGNLSANIHGLDIRALGATVAGVYGPHDLQAYLNATGGYKDLLVGYIKGVAGTRVPVNLRGIVEGWYSLNLLAYISSISPANLLAYLNAVGQAANLLASIVPRIIYLKQAVRVSLLEHLDLHAMVNFACFTSDHRNLDAYLYPIMKLDLRAVIFGWHVNIYSNVKDLALYINTGIYNVEDRISVGFFPTPLEYTLLKLKFTASETYKMFNTIRLLFSGVHRANLSAVVTGILESLNLGAYIKPVFDWNYSELPPDVNPKTHEVVIDFSAKWRENWRRFVELMFDNSGNSPYHYFYVSGADQVYRVDRNRHWIVRAKSYRRTDDMIERRDVRYKYVFKMSDYANVDEAIRDLIDRVSAYRRVNLRAYINGGLPTHSNLNAIIYPDIKHSWVKHLHASITGTGGFFGLSATIAGIP